MAAMLIVNLADVLGLRPLKGHAVYSVAKAANLMLTRALLPPGAGPA